MFLFQKSVDVGTLFKDISEAKSIDQYLSERHDWPHRLHYALIRADTG